MSVDPQLEATFLVDSAIDDGWFVTVFDHPRYGGGWLALRNPCLTVTAWKTSEVVPLIELVDKHTTLGLSAAGYVAYDAAPAFDSAFAVQGIDGSPLACFHFYDSPPVFYKELLRTGSAEISDWTLEIGREEFLKQCSQIKSHLAAGDSYQVNLSFRLRASSTGRLSSLFANLAAEEPPPYASLFLSNEFGVASLSPELFFELAGDAIRCKPMKGTAALGAGNAERLRDSEKDCAENLMVVDMIRNDLGRVAEIGSVRTPSLFDVAAFPTVLQMTSTVEATFSGSLTEAFGALFPCASIVGAPKVKTMEIIRDLEPSPRGVYTGAVGLAGPARMARFGVAIRTISAVGPQLEYGAGSGIVWDSEPESEWRETVLKTEALRQRSPEWELFETFRWPDRPDLPLVALHLDRLASSAKAFDISFDRADAIAKLSDLGTEERRVKLSLSRTGEIDVRNEPFRIPSELRAKVAPDPVRSNDPLLRHKTNRRRIYDRALRQVGTDEALLWNERGEATEFCRGNLVIRADGQLWTPALECGLLPGILREHLLRQSEIRERSITLAEVESADEVFRINSLTGWVRVEMGPQSTQKDVD